MIGQYIFGCPPLATETKIPAPQRGWVKKCKSTTDWGIVVRNTVNTVSCDVTSGCIKNAN